MAVKLLRQLAVPDQADCLFALPPCYIWNNLLDHNRRTLVQVGGRGISRRELSTAAIRYTRQIGLRTEELAECKHIIVTGHQPLWRHCGVLAKDIIADRFANETGGIALHLVLDHDIVETSMVLPELDSAGFMRFQAIPLECSRQNMPLELRPAPCGRELDSFINSVTKLKKSLCSEIWRSSLHRFYEYLDSCRNIADLVTLLQAVVYQSLGLELIYLPVSLLSDSASFKTFVCSIVCDAVNFADAYNQGILSRIHTQNLNAAQTLRPLEIDRRNNDAELPFWLMFKTGIRVPLQVECKNNNIILLANSAILGAFDLSNADDNKQQLFEILNAYNCVIRPKAVTLDLFARLYLADWFVHGVGGGKYASITDNIIRKYFNLANLHFGVATATLTLPTESNTNWLNLTESQFELQLRKLKFNPEIFIEYSNRNIASVKSLIDVKKQLIDTAGNPRASTFEKNRAWQNLAKINAELLEYVGHGFKNMLLDGDIRNKYIASGKVMRSREFFFGLFPEKSIKNLLDSKEIENENGSYCRSPSR
jgi:hypothetical protein